MHLAWCGRVEAMEQSYRNLFLQLDEDFHCMEFFSSTEEFIPEDILSTLEFGPLTCKPRFALFYEGEKMAEVDGADYTTLMLRLREYLPNFEDD